MPGAGLCAGLSLEFARTLRFGVLLELPLGRNRDDHVGGMRAAHLPCKELSLFVFVHPRNANINRRMRVWPPKHEWGRVGSLSEFCPGKSE